MKRITKILTFMFVAFLIFGATNVYAATLKLKNESGKVYNVDVTDTKATVADIKKQIKDEVKIEADKQIWYLDDEVGTFFLDDMTMEYILSSYQDTVLLAERKEMGDVVEIKAAVPGTMEEAYAIFERIQFPGYYLDVSSMSEPYSKGTMYIAATNAEYKQVTFKYVYNATTAKDIASLASKLATRKTFELKDLELVNYWINGGSPINYSDDYKSLVGYKNFYLDIKAGSDDILETASLGSAYYIENGTIYKALELSVENKNVLYVPNSTDNSKITEALQARIDKYVGNGKVTILKNTAKTVSQYASEKIDYYNAATWMTPTEKAEYIAKENAFKALSADNVIYIAKIGSKEYNFIVAKDDAKMYTPIMKTSDYKTNITISAEDGRIPLDTMIKVTELSSGAEYDKILKALNITESEMFDLKLFSTSTNKYVTKLDDGTFEVRIPLSANYQDKDIAAYYVDDNGKITEYKITKDGNFAVFNTDHFSIYTLAERSRVTVPTTSTVRTSNPETGDSIMLNIVIVAVSIISIMGCVVFVSKKV